MAVKIYPLNMAIQAEKIRHLFPESNVMYNQTILTWKYSLRPSPLSAEYDVRLVYRRDEHPNMYVVNQKLELYKESEKLPHVYDNERQRLCLYFKKTHEWNSAMFISETIIPWTSEWLLHYECWLSTGIWHGGGIH